MNPIIYWGINLILALIHLQSLLSLLPFEVPIYVTALFVAGVGYLLQKRILLHINALGKKGNALLFGMQGLLIIGYIASESAWVYVIWAGLFIFIEIFRLGFSKRIHSLQKDLASYEEQREQLNETFRMVRSERHDFLKHVSSLHFMLENEKQKEAKDYLQQLVEGYEETNLSIKGERGVVAGILHQMYRRAKSSGIEVVYDLDIPLSTLPLSDKEIVALAGNLLSNSIDACEEWQKAHGRQAHLTLHFYKRSGLFLLVCENDSPAIPTEVLDQLFVSYGHTTKSEGHEGLGTKIISKLVSQYNGYLDFVHKDEKFTIKIKIPAVV